MNDETTQAKQDPRHNARILAVQTIFNNLSKELENSETLPFDLDALLEVNEQFEFDEQLFDNIVAGVEQNTSEINEIISKNAPERPLEQISLIDRVILSISIAEGFVSGFTPAKVAINEGIELTKDFATESNRKFVSGVLGSLYESYKKE